MRSHNSRSFVSTIKQNHTVSVKQLCLPSNLHLMKRILLPFNNKTIRLPRMPNSIDAFIDIHETINVCVHIILVV